MPIHRWMLAQIETLIASIESSQVDSLVPAVGGAMPPAVDRGDDDLAGAAEAEHPALRRIRHRRLLAFLHLQGLERTFQSMARETDAAFSAAHLGTLVARGQWRDAIGYLSRFLPPGGDGGRLPSVEARVLRRFLAVHADLADILAGTERGDALAADFREYRSHDRTVSRGSLRIRCIVLAALHDKQHLSTGKRSHQKKKKKNKLQLCRRTRAYIIVDRYLLERGRLHFSSRSKESPDENEKKMNWVADLVDRSLKAGEPPKLHQESPLQTSGKQGSTSASVSQTTVGALARTARDSGMPSAANAGTNAGELAMHGAPFSRTTTGATVSQTKTLV
ncbi:uncharacterized protein LOC120644760 isoform X2 [Panicum virgatum]|uniref:uncharacterized protein LOC120644760 isoform X2 n=1 Tax=Panicum virgatum TaxID=38727 RepID=UPI0019D677EA|nr:uncharacterized protein LOC120644760 isoform X2 [Panicum virgatum]